MEPGAETPQTSRIREAIGVWSGFGRWLIALAASAAFLYWFMDPGMRHPPGVLVPDEATAEPDCRAYPAEHPGLPHHGAGRLLRPGACPTHRAVLVGPRVRAVAGRFCAWLGGDVGPERRRPFVHHAGQALVSVAPRETAAPRFPVPEIISHSGNMHLHPGGPERAQPVARRSPRPQ